MATSGMEAELVSLKEVMGAECRVIKDVGEFSHVVNLRPADLEFVLKFQLTGKLGNQSPPP